MGTAKRERQKQGRQARIAQAQAAAAKRKRLRNAVLLGLLVLALVAVTFVVGAGGDDDDDVTAAGSTTTVDPTASSTTLQGGAPTPPELPEGATITGETPCPAPDGSSERTTTFEQPPPMCIDPTKTYTAVFTTNLGEVRVALDTQTTPIATNNFVVLARYHYYDGTVITRTATSIGIVQGGSPHTQTNGDPGPGYTIEDEGFGDDVVAAGTGGPYRYLPGDLVYARPGGQPDSSSAQFFFCVDERCSGLDSQGIYVKFGQTTTGLEVLQAILADSPEGDAQPNNLVTIESVTIEET